jgi:hypothetical protein
MSRQIIFYENHFDFFKTRWKSQEKIKYVLGLIKQVEKKFKKF